MAVPAPKQSNAFDIRSPFIQSRPEGKNAQIFEKEAQKTVGEKIKGLFAIVCAQTKTMTPGDESKDFAGLWLQTAGIISQMMNTNKVEENTSIQKATYNAGLARFVGYSIEGAGDRVKFDGKHEVTVRTNIAPADSVRRTFEILSGKNGSLVRRLLLAPDEKEITWDGKDDSGNEVEKGGYIIRVINYDESGKEQYQPTFVSREIDGLSYEDGMPHFTHDGQKFYEINRWTQPRKQKLSQNI